MRTIQNNSGSDNIGKAFIEDGDFRNDNKNSLKIKYHKANLVEITSIFKSYSIDAGHHQKKICCPFPSHQDNSASFYYYSNTNSFFCYGCKVGGGPVEFVSAMDDIQKNDAINKILLGYENNIDIDVIIQKDFISRQETMLGFSNYIRNIRNKNTNLNKSLEDMCKIFDTLNIRHSLDNDALKSLIKKLKVKIECQLV